MDMWENWILPELTRAVTSWHVSRFATKRVAVDASSCALKLPSVDKTKPHIESCKKYVRLLRGAGVTPVFVFDAQPRPQDDAKLSTSIRDENVSIKLTPEMMKELILELRQEKVDYIVSPTNANAQITHLVNRGYAECGISDDPNLIVFGCDKVMMDLNFLGMAKLYERSKLATCFNLRQEQLSFPHFRWMCILVGCGNSVLDMKRAKELVFASNASTIDELLEYAKNQLGAAIISPEHVAAFKRVEQAILQKFVYDPKNRVVQPLSDCAVNPATTTLIESELNLGLALGNVCPTTLEVTDNFDPMKMGYPITSIWWNEALAQQPVPESSDSVRLESEPQVESVPTILVAISDNLLLDGTNAATRPENSVHSSALETPVPESNASQSDCSLLGPTAAIGVNHCAEDRKAESVAAPLATSDLGQDKELAIETLQAHRDTGTAFGTVVLVQEPETRHPLPMVHSPSDDDKETAGETDSEMRANDVAKLGPESDLPKFPQISEEKPDKFGQVVDTQGNENLGTEKAQSDAVSSTTAETPVVMANESGVSSQAKESSTTAKPVDAPKISPSRRFGLSRVKRVDRKGPSVKDLAEKNPYVYKPSS